MRSRAIRIGVVSLFAFGSLAVPAWALPPYLAPDNKIPSLDLEADSPGIVAFTIGIMIRYLELHNPTNQVPAGSGNFNVGSFWDVFTEISIDGGNSWTPHQTTGFSNIHVDPEQPSGPLSIYDTEMLSINISGGTLPPGYMLRESPTLASNGTTSIQPVGGGLYQIDSFFDVFFEISVDGGQNWSPGTSSGPGGSLPLNGSPEPATALLLAAGALVMLRRRRAA